MSGAAIERIDGVPVVRISDDIDAANAGAMQQQLEDALAPEAQSLIIDLSETRYIDSAGLDMLLRLGNRLDHRRAKLMLVIAETSQLNRLAAIVGLPQAMPVRSTLDEALQAAAKLSRGETVAPHTAGRQEHAGT